MPTFTGTIGQTVELDRKFTKGEAGYRDRGRGILYVCARCRHYEAASKSCAIVSSEGEPNPGEILPQGVSKLWNAGSPRLNLFKGQIEENSDGTEQQSTRRLAVTNLL
jgi:hypothetical protein